MALLIDIMWHKQNISETITIVNDNDLRSLCKRLSNKIVDEFSHKIIDYIIEYEYFYFQQPEQIFLENQSKEEFDKSDKKLIYEYLEKELFIYLSENKHINIQGFLTFRADQFIEYLHLTIDDIISQYLAELETNELVDYLKDYLNNQEPISETLYIVSETNNKYSILNDTFELIVLINKYDDLLLNTIINIAPKCICIYGNIENVRLKRVLKQIFEDGISFYHHAYKITDG